MPSTSAPPAAASTPERLATPAPEQAPALERALRAGGLRTVFQPIVDLRTGATVGYEALTRGPARSDLEAPDRLFAAARRAQRVVELDWACRCQAFRAAAPLLRPPTRLFVNAEPRAFDRACPLHLVRDWLTAHRRLRVVVELTERYLLEDPAALLRTRATLRELGWELALDDVGANDAGVALLPLLRPDVVKLDKPLLEDQPSSVRSSVLAAVRGYAEGSGALVVAEGIETLDQRQRALDLGASWGQGFLFGRPAPLSTFSMPPPGEHHRPASSADHGMPDARVPTDPFDLLDGRVRARRLAVGEVHDELLRVCRRPDTAVHGALLLVVAGTDSALPVELDQLLDQLCGPCALVVVLTGPGVRSRALLTRRSPIDPGDRVRQDAAAVLITPRHARAFYARRSRDGIWSAVTDDDGERVSRAARALLARVLPVPSGRPRP